MSASSTAQGAQHKEEEEEIERDYRVWPCFHRRYFLYRGRLLHSFEVFNLLALSPIYCVTNFRSPHNSENALKTKGIVAEEMVFAAASTLKQHAIQMNAKNLR